MSYKYLLYEKGDGIGTVTINRPEVLNALNSGVMAELYDVFDQIEDDPEVRVVILTGAGDRAFVAGADITEMAPQSSTQIEAFIRKFKKAMDRVYSVSKPVIGALNGHTLGGGCELAMCCDVRIAAEKATFGQPEINLAIIPGGGGTQRLTRLIGMGRAKELIYTGDMIKPEAALAMGLINKVVPLADLMTEARAMAAKMLSKSSVALAMAKRAVNTGANTDLDSALDIEIECFALCFSTEDQKEGMKAFKEKRKPVFKNR